MPYKADFTKAGPPYRLPHPMAAPEEWEKDMAELEHEQRSAAFNDILAELGRLDIDPGRASFFRDYTSDMALRSVLVIRHKASQRRPAGIRVLVNDEETDNKDVSRLILSGYEYAVRSFGSLITARECQLPEDGDGDWKLTKTGFLVQKPDDSPITYIFHGQDYHPDLPADVPEVSVGELNQRYLTARDLVAVLRGLQVADSMPTDYIFNPVVVP